MNAGQVASLIWDVIAWFFIISFVVFPLSYARWRKSEQARKKAVEAALATTRQTKGTSHHMDAM